MEENSFPVFWQGWKTLSLIGAGGYGKVYKICREDDETDICALKVVSIPNADENIEDYTEEGYDSAAITTMFTERKNSIVSEFKTMNKFKGSSYIVSSEDYMCRRHPNGIGWDVLIRMECLTPIKKILPMEESEVVRLGVYMCRALELCESENIIHRDIKPENIFVNKFRDFKLGDFGIARTMEQVSRATKIGTYNYMAPEVYHGMPYGASVDIYSLGLVLHWILNERRAPFVCLPPEVPTANAVSEAVARRMEGEPFPAPVNGSEELKRIVLRACAYRPEDRYHTAAEMEADLKKLPFDFSYETKDPAQEERTSAEPTGFAEVPDNAGEKTQGIFRVRKTDAAGTGSASAHEQPAREAPVIREAPVYKEPEEEAVRETVPVKEETFPEPAEVPDFGERTERIAFRMENKKEESPAPPTEPEKTVPDTSGEPACVMEKAKDPDPVLSDKKAESFPNGAADPQLSDKTRMEAALLSFLLGAWGVQYKYLGFREKAKRRLIIGCTVYGTIVTFILGIIDGFGFLKGKKEKYLYDADGRRLR